MGRVGLEGEAAEMGWGLQAWDWGRVSLEVQ